VLRAGSVLGRTFTLPVVAGLTGRRAVELATDVDEALAAGLLQATGDRLTFSHDLVREGIYDALPGAVRSAMHVDAARALAANDAQAFDVATQVERTAGGVDPEVVDWLIRGARQVRVTAPATAAAFLRRAGEVLDPGDDRWLEVQTLLAEAHVFSGSQLDGQALAQQCLDLPGLPEANRVDLTYLLGQAQFLLGHLTEAAARFEESARPDSPNRPGALADGALALLLGGDLAGAAELADRSMAAAQEQGDVGAEIFVLAALSWIRALEGDLAGGLELGARGVALADSAGTLEVHRNVPWLFYAQVLLWADRDAEATVAIERASELGERLGLVWDVPLRHLLRARAHHRGGDWDRALAEAQAGLSQSTDQGGSIGEVWLLCVLARLTVARGELDDADRALDAAEEAAALSGQGLDQIAWARGLLAEARGDADAAGLYLDLLWDGLQGRGLDYYVWDIAPDVIRVALRRDDRARVDQVLAAVGEIAERTQDSSAPVVAARCQGLATLDPEATLSAIGLLDVRKAGARPVERSLLQSEAAALLDHVGRGAEAAALRAEAEPVLRQAGAVPPGVPGTQPAAPTPDDAATFGWASLTSRELEVIALLAESLSNAEIAERLYCSRRTVESHLSHAYTKLGITSRVELAVEAARRLGADDP
jgi:DNA-binding CsgD family transcriptional regulator